MPQGHLDLQGPLADFPYVEHPDGHWSVDFDAADAELAFAPGWEPLEKIKAHVLIAGRTLGIDAEGATIGGASADSAHAAVADFDKSPELSIDGRVHGDAASFYSVLRASPLQKRLGGLLDRTDLAGPAQLALHLDIPLNSAHGDDIHSSGTVQLAAATLKVKGLAEPVREVAGTVNFDDAGVRADGLRGRLYDLVLAARIGTDAASPDGRLDVGFDAPLDADNGAAAAFLPAWLRARMTGTAHFTASLPFSGPQGGVLTLRSELRGVAADLPPPLRKAAGDALPVAVQIGGDASAPLHLLVGLPDERCGTLCIALRFADVSGQQPLRGVELHFGADAVPQAAADGIVVTGSPAELDAGALIGFLSGNGLGEASNLPLRSVDLSPASIVEGDFRIPATHLQLQQTPTGWALSADGDGVKGTIVETAAVGGHVLARLEHLHLQPIEEAAQSALAPEKPAGQPGADRDIIDPARAPTFDVGIGHLQVAGTDFGGLVMTTSRITDGQSIDSFRIGSGLLGIDARGNWRRTKAGSSAEAGFNVASSDFGTVLKAFGYAQSMTGRNAKITGQLSWAPRADGIEPKLADGTLHLEVDNGALTAVDPGAGRVLGLLNLYALPRRLTLNFSDVVSKGLAFDRLRGSFALGGGNAMTDDMQINGPSVRMEIRGRVGLVARDYDEHVTVYPGLSTGAVIGAGLAGGPAGVAIALVAQQLFNKPLDRLTRFSYRLTGGWDNPQIHRGDVTPANPAVPTDATPGAAPAGKGKDEDSDEDQG